LHQFNETTKALHVSIIEEKNSLQETHKQTSESLKKSAIVMASQLQESSKYMGSLHAKLIERFIEALGALQTRLEADSTNPTPEVESLRESLRMIDAETEQIIQKLDALK
jgi:small-conductance mechanosensitive channel